jgi:hypothetical protein
VARKSNLQLASDLQHEVSAAVERPQINSATDVLREMASLYNESRSLHAAAVASSDQGLAKHYFGQSVQLIDKLAKAHRVYDDTRVVGVEINSTVKAALEVLSQDGKLADIISGQVIGELKGDLAQ